MIVLVVGMHRSGTSLVARGLHVMGANLGECVDTGPHPANPHGHWEHDEVWRGQEALLIRFGREWHSSPGPLPDRWLQWPDAAARIGTELRILRIWADHQRSIDRDAAGRRRRGRAARMA